MIQALLSLTSPDSIIGSEFGSTLGGGGGGVGGLSFLVKIRLIFWGKVLLGPM